jgi:hypothetical protein
MVKIYQQPFAHAGTKQVIPDASDPQGFVSNEDGFTTDYELPDTDPNYKPIERAEFNGLMNMVTEAVGELQQFGFAKWQPMTWPQGARVVEGGVVYRALNQTSQQPPHADWVDDTDELVRLTGNQTIAGVKTFSSFPVTPSSAPTTNYQVANKKYVDDKADSSGLGVGQTWQGVKASRVSGTTYTNTTGKPIQVAISSFQGVAGYPVSASITVDGETITNTSYGAGQRAAVFAIVPPGGTYKAVLEPQGVSQWIELR